MRTSGDLLTCVGATPAGTKIELGVLRDGAPLALPVVLGERPLIEGMATPPPPTPDQELRHRVLTLYAQLGRTRDPVARDAIVREIKSTQASLASLGIGQPPDAEELGLVAHAISRQASATLGIRGGVEVDSATPGSPAEEAGLLPFDVIVRAGSSPVSDVNSLDVGIRAARNSGATALPLQVLRKGATVVLRVVLPPRHARPASVPPK